MQHVPATRPAPQPAAQNGILLRPLRPVLPLFVIAFWLDRNGLLSHTPSLPGAFDVALVGAPAALRPARSGPCERRGSRNARTSRRTQKAATITMVMTASYPRP